MNLKSIVPLILLCSIAWSHAASVITARLTFTNASVLTNAVFTSGSNATVTVNSDTRTWTNSITSPATQIPLTSVNGTNISQQVQRFLVHSYTYKFTGITPSSDGSTYVDLRGTNDQALTVSIVPTNYGTITYSTQTVGSAYTLRLPITVESGANQTIIADLLVAALGYSTTPPSYSVGASNTVWVSKGGSDNNGARGKFDKPFLTLLRAKTNAVSGDTIFVLPGTYNESDLLKTGVNWHFFNGATVTNSSATLAIFDDQSGAMISSVTGHGSFIDGGSFGIVSITNSSSTLSIKGKTLTGGIPPVLAGGGTLTLEADEVLATSTNAVKVFNSVGTFTFNRTRLKTSSSAADARPIHIAGTNSGVVLRDCLLITGASGTNSIYATSACNLRMYGSNYSNSTNGPTVTLITGDTLFIVDTDVQ